MRAADQQIPQATESETNSDKSMSKEKTTNNLGEHGGGTSNPAPQMTTALERRESLRNSRHTLSKRSTTCGCWSTSYRSGILRLLRFSSAQDGMTLARTV